jgi:DNA-directed RNA polymerase specialized sigma24 family protein
MRALALFGIVSANIGPADSPEERCSLIEAAKAGDLAAFELLMRQYERLVLVTALRLLGSMADAQDVSQEVFLKLYRNLGKVQSTSGLTAWLYRVTVNACRDVRRTAPTRSRRPPKTSAAACWR